MTKHKNNRAGFTIVELVIVITVISILATITYISYTGLQNNEKTDTSRANVSVIARKIEAYGSIRNSYPDATTASAYSAALNSLTDSSISDIGLNIGSPDQTNGTTTLEVSQCTSYPGGAYRIRHWDFGKKTMSTDVASGKIGAACTTWQVLN